MKVEKALAKIEKAVAKNKSKAIIKLTQKADNEVVVKALEALGKINDEDSRNFITSYMDNENESLRIAACKAAIEIGSEYMKTKVRYQISVEQNLEIKRALLDALNNAN